MRTPRFLQPGWLGRSDDVLIRDVEPLEGTSVSLWNTYGPIESFWADTYGTPTWGTADLVQKVWVTSRAQDLNCQQLSGMPLRWHGTEGTDEPAWVSNPDPVLFPNGIGDALYAVTNDMYGWGYALLYVTDYYVTGFPRRWTVIPAASCEPKFNEFGRREYKMGETLLDPARVVQIDRNPTTAAHGTSAIRSYAQVVLGLLAAQNQSTSVTTGGTPKFYLKSEHKLTKEQAESIQAQWATATANRNGMPPVVDPRITPTEMSFNPSDLALLENQEWSARIAATAYGVPSVILNMALVGGLTYQNPIALMQMWWHTELRNKAKRLADAFNAQMLPRGQWVHLDATDVTSDPMNPGASEDDPQLAAEVPPPTANASPAQNPLTAIGGGRA